MAQAVVQWIVWLAVWVLRRWAPGELAPPVVPPPPPPPPDPAPEAVWALIQYHAATPHTGAWKAAQVKIELYRLFPKRRKRTLNLLVEQLVQDL